MMNRCYFIAFFAITGLLSGCSSDYVMQTKNGDMIVTKGKPEVDKGTGLVTYKDAGGVRHEINRDQITQMIEK